MKIRYDFLLCIIIIMILSSCYENDEKLRKLERKLQSYKKQIKKIRKKEIIKINRIQKSKKKLEDSRKKELKKLEKLQNSEMELQQELEYRKKREIQDIKRIRAMEAKVTAERIAYSIELVAKKRIPRELYFRKSHILRGFELYYKSGTLEKILIIFHFYRNNKYMREMLEFEIVYLNTINSLNPEAFEQIDNTIKAAGKLKKLPRNTLVRIWAKPKKGKKLPSVKGWTFGKVNIGSFKSLKGSQGIIKRRTANLITRYHITVR